MKKFFFLLAVALPCLIITSCGDDDDADSANSSGTAKGGKAVDLGLSVKWADRNVGASSPEEYGYYFAWGETKPKDAYNWDTYKWCKGSFDTMTKYCTNSSSGVVDNKTTLEPNDDAATANWGKSWRMPTHEEQTELRLKCTWTWIEQNGVPGYKVTGPNGNSIFLPAAGYHHTKGLKDEGTDGYYWASTLYSYFPSEQNNAFYLWITEEFDDDDAEDRFQGHSVRPVCQ